MDTAGAHDLLAAKRMRDLLAAVSTVDDMVNIAAITRLVAAEQAGQTRTITVGPYTLFCIISAMQLAVRHPGISGAMNETLAAVARALIDLFEGDGEVVGLLQRGFDPEHDR